MRFLRQKFTMDEISNAHSNETKIEPPWEQKAKEI